jgi:hypothetical protein
MNERNLVIISDKNQNGLAVLGYNIQSFNAILDKYLQLASVGDVHGDDFHGFVTWTDLRLP